MFLIDNADYVAGFIVLRDCEVYLYENEQYCEGVINLLWDSPGGIDQYKQVREDNSNNKFLNEFFISEHEGQIPNSLIKLPLLKLSLKIFREYLYSLLDSNLFESFEMVKKLLFNRIVAVLLKIGYFEV